MRSRPRRSALPSLSNAYWDTNMVTKEVRQVRCHDALTLLTKDGTAVFFTLTTPDVVDFDEIRRRWRVFRHDFFRRLTSMGKSPLYVMNYEAHPGYLQKICRDYHGEYVKRSDGNSHGWHIHGVCSCFLPSSVLLIFANRAGFGRCDFRRVSSSGVSNYLTKHALKAYRGLSEKDKKLYQGSRRRLVNCSRCLPSLSDYSYHSPFKAKVDSIFNYHRTNERHFTSAGELIKVNFSDYRKLYLRSTVCALLRIPFLSDLPSFLDKLRISQNCKNRLQ